MPHIEIPPLLDADGAIEAVDEVPLREGPSEDERQIEVPPLLAMVLDDAAAAAAAPMYARRSVELMQHARDTQGKNTAKRKLVFASSQLESKKRVLDLVSRVLPAAAFLLGQSVQRAHTRKQFKPEDVCALALAAHWPPTMKGSPGMNRQRLTLVASRIIEARQCDGLKVIHANAAEGALMASTCPEVKKVYMVSTHSHEWDETAAKFKALATQGTHTSVLSHSQSSVETLVQRGTLSFFLHEHEEDDQQGKSEVWTEEWISAPRMVPGTRTEQVQPAILAGIPDSYRFDRPESVKDLRKSSDVHIYLPIGDKASSNVLFLKWACCVWEAVMQQLGSNVPRYLIAPSTCQVHSHHRGKLQLVVTKVHIARHYGIGSLFKQHGVQLVVHRNLERLVHGQSQRLLEDPPLGGNQALYAQLDSLYGFGKEHHKKANGTLSKHVNNLFDLLKLLNKGGGDHCCGRDPRSRCCKSESDFKEKLFCTVRSLLLGNQDAQVCESRWTHLLPALKKSLVRKLLQNWGVQSLDTLAGSTQIPHDGVHDVDADAFLGSLMAEMNGIRIDRVKKYFADSKTWMELAILVPILDISDDMLYFMLGGQDRIKPPGKLLDMVKRSGSMIGITLQKLFGLLSNWCTDDPCRIPWCLLDAVQAPIHDAAFKKFARGQVLKAASIWSRRYENKFGSLPYSLYTLNSSEYSNAEKDAFITELRDSKRCCLDPFTYGLLLLFPSADGLRSQNCKDVVNAFLHASRLSTDWSERQNAEITATRCIRGPGRDFESAARSLVVKQARVVHMTGGGDDPLKPIALSSSSTRGTISTLRVCKPAPLQDAVAREDGDQEMQAEAGRVGGHEAEPDGLAIVPFATVTRDELRGASLLDSVPVVLNSLSPEGDDHPPSDGVLALNPTPIGPPPRRRGLNPYFLYKNDLLAQAKQMKGRKLTQEEVSVRTTLHFVTADSC